RSHPLVPSFPPRRSSDLIHRVDALDPGLYLLVRNPVALAPLKASLRHDWLWRKIGPPELPLYLLIAHDLRDSARLVCCHQDIAADRKSTRLNSSHGSNSY